MDAVCGQQLHMAVLNEIDPVQIDHTQVWRMRLDFANVDHLEQRKGGCKC